MGNKNICVIPGTFDPVTNGHIDVVARVSGLFDLIYVASFENSAKKTMFSPQERKEMLRLACDGICGGEKIIVEATNELLADYAKSKNAGYIVKGVRNAADYEYEYMLSMINREIGGIDTLLIPAKSEYAYISSSFVKEMIIYGREIAGYVPPKAYAYINETLKMAHRAGDVKRNT